MLIPFFPKYEKFPSVNIFNFLGFEEGSLLPCGQSTDSYRGLGVSEMTFQPVEQEPRWGVVLKAETLRGGFDERQSRVWRGRLVKGPGVDTEPHRFLCGLLWQDTH